MQKLESGLKNQKIPIEFELKEHLKLENLFELVTDWIWIMDTNGVHIYSNQAVEELLGYKREEIIGISAWELWPSEEKEKITKMKYQNDLKSGKSWTQYPGKFEHKEGSIIFLESSAVPIFDDEDTLIGYLGIDRDVTKRRKKAERDKFLHSLLRHDLRNKIQVTKGYLQLIQKKETEDEVSEFLERALYSLSDQENLLDKINKLKEIEKEDEICEMDLSKVIDKVMSEYQDKLQKINISLEIDYFPCMVKGGALLYEMFSNLFENSIQHSNCDKIKLFYHIEADKCLVTFEDDGVGVTGGVRTKIFNRGYRSGESAGSGLGLYLVKEIITGYGGSIEVKDSDMGGARFDIRLERIQNKQ